jgi:HNH endonuclease
MLADLSFPIAHISVRLRHPPTRPVDAGVNRIDARFDTMVEAAGLIMASESKKREWFDLGATAFAKVRPGQFDQPTYPCPICLRPFTVEALADKRLSVEHVPPKSFGGRELLLTCKVCNNSSGTRMDADAKTKEDVRIAMAGMDGRPHRIRATIGGQRINGELHVSGGKYSLQIPPIINKPGTSEFLRNVAREGVPLTVQHESFSELGTKISWLRSGYLALFAMYWI